MTKNILPAIADFYNNSSEDTRLSIGLGPLEFERNKALISQHLKPKMAIADIGGGTGHYATWLAKLGHRVTLLDPIKKHIDQAQKKAKQHKVNLTCLLGDARSLALPNSSFDMVILHGPLYHLQQPEERQLALSEAKRVLKPSGILLGFAITRAAFTIAALNNGAIHHDDVFKMCKTELTTGKHEPPAHLPGILTSAYFHRPMELREEVARNGFEIIDVSAVEGMAWMDSSFFQSWADVEKKKRLLELIELTANDPELLGLSPHMVVTARKL